MLQDAGPANAILICQPPIHSLSSLPSLPFLYPAYFLLVCVCWTCVAWLWRGVPVRRFAEGSEPRFRAMLEAEGSLWHPDWQAGCFCFFAVMFAWKVKGPAEVSLAFEGKMVRVMAEESVLVRALYHMTSDGPGIPA